MLVDPEPETLELQNCVSLDGQRKLLAELFTRHRDRLRSMVDLRLDPRLRGRIDPSDVLQEAFVESLLRLKDFLSAPPMAFFLWLRCITGNAIITVHRRHFRGKRDARREVSLDQALPEASSARLAACLMHKGPSPGKAASRAELRSQLERALEGMDFLDREVIALRHFEGLSNGEVAATLGLEVSAASKRYYRALAKLKKILADMGIEAPED